MVGSFCLLFGSLSIIQMYLAILAAEVAWINSASAEMVDTVWYYLVIYATEAPAMIAICLLINLQLLTSV
eukprot:868084-Ditylum_brightwellii.AAC.1